MTAIEKYERLRVMLADPCYAEINKRFESGDLKFELEDDCWPEGWYQNPDFNKSIPLALDLAGKLPDVKVFRLYYWREQDFHHVQFDYDGDTFIVQWYKIFTVHRKSNGGQHYFDRWSGQYDIPGFFKQGRHKTSPHWGEGSQTFNPFNHPATREKVQS